MCSVLIVLQTWRAHTPLSLASSYSYISSVLIRLHVRRAAMLLKSGVSCFLMAMLCLVSAQDTIQCYVVTAQKKRDFMQLKVKKLMNVLTEKLIHTVIPPNVLDGITIKLSSSNYSYTLQDVRRDMA
jgi:hypothetical protein